MPDLRGFDGLAVVETLLDTRISGCLKPGQRHPGPCKGWRGTHLTEPVPHIKKVKLAPLLPTGGGKKRPATGSEIAELRKGFDGTFAGLTTRLQAHTVEINKNGRLSLIGQIFTPDGQAVGQFQRELYEDDHGIRHAEHKIIQLEAHVQGQGFATRFNEHLFEWYREHGLSEAHLNADIDVGGIAWAAQGDWDWRRHRDARKIRQRIFHTMNLANGDDEPDEEDFYPPPWEKMDPAEFAAQLPLAEAMAERLNDESRFGEEDFPHPYEVYNMGRKRGQGKDDWWIGKVIMWGSDWNATTPI